MGFGDWLGRTNWPFSEIKSETSNITILGITYANTLDQAMELSWSQIIEKIKFRIRFLSQRNLTLIQRSVIINTTLL